MIVDYKSKKIKKICTDFSSAKKEHGNELALKIFQRIEQISASNSIDELISFNIGRCHALSGDRSGQYAMDLGNPFRLVFSVEKTEMKEVAIIIEVIDYH